MDTKIYDVEWKQELYALIQKARSERKWLRCAIDNMWFSPNELEHEHRSGRFMWGAVNWSLENPFDYLDQAIKSIADAMAKRDQIRDRIGKGF